MSDVEVWGYSSSEEPEMWQGACATRAEAIDEATAEFDGEPFWLIQGRRLSAAQFINIDSIIEMANEAEEFSVYDDAPFEPSKEALDELSALISEWARKHCMSIPWVVTGSPERVETQTG